MAPTARRRGIADLPSCTICPRFTSTPDEQRDAALLERFREPRE
jgi:hypothetical protein